MTFGDPQKYRERLVLLSSLRDDGLEELVLRLVKPEYPDAHRTRRGRDRGIDVLSDYGTPPYRAWQAKNYVDSGVDWRWCRESLEAAMAGPVAPLRYTFVFPRPLTASERDYWRDKFLPEAKQKYSHLQRLDYVDDLAQRLEGHPELVDRLNDGVLAGYVRDVLGQTAETGVNPLASAADLVTDARLLAERSKAIGNDDPYFVYGQSGREAAARDAGQASFRWHLELDNMPHGLPRYSASLRDQDLITEIFAEPRKEVEINVPRAWFSPDAQGDHLRAAARASLAQGREITIEDSAAGLRVPIAPNRFQRFLDSDGVARGGALRLVPATPLARMLKFKAHGTEYRYDTELYAIPPEPGATAAFGTTVGCELLCIDLYLGDNRSESPEGSSVEARMQFKRIEGKREPLNVVDGLAFTKLRKVAEEGVLECPQLFPVEGLPLPRDLDHEDESERVFALIARALLLLNERDGGERMVPDSIGEEELGMAAVIISLLKSGEARLPAVAEFEVGLPRDTPLDADPTSLTAIETQLPALVDGSDPLPVFQDIIGARPLRVIEKEDRKFLVCRSEGEAALVFRLPENAGENEPCADGSPES
jgi:hypothetical protein